jgi:uncharacterized protein
MKILRARDLPQTPWKNGGGVTMEIAVHPADASMDNFDWRVSMAIVDAGGPFSTFPNIDRTLTILEGGPLGLQIGGAQEILLDSISDPVSFAGDVPTRATLYGKRVIDLNIMTRRNRFRHHVTQLSFNGQAKAIKSQSSCFIVLREGEISVIQNGFSEDLLPADCVYLDERSDRDFVFQSQSRATAFMVEIFSEQKRIL